MCPGMVAVCSRKPPASSAGLIPRGSSSSPSGFPRVSATIRSRTCSSRWPGMAAASSERASSSASPSSVRVFRPGKSRSSPVSLTASRSRTASASRRRPTNPRTWQDASSSHWASSMRQTSGRFAATSASKPSTARPTMNRSGGFPAASPNATLNACSWGSGRAPISPSIGRHSWCSAANGISNSDSTPATCATRQPDAWRRQ